MTQSQVLLIFLLLTLGSCKKQQPVSAQIIDFDKHYSITTDYKDSTLTVKIKLDDMLHAYAEGEKIGRPVSLTIKEHNGWQALGPAIVPKGNKKMLIGLGESVTLDNEIELKQKVIKGQGPGQALVYLQVCTDNACDRPKEHVISFGY
jgi:hypothetical protein